jgi:phage terminase Nu1 subunit (DNA packaging protein)
MDTTSGLYMNNLDSIFNPALQHPEMLFNSPADQLIAMGSSGKKSRAGARKKRSEKSYDELSDLGYTEYQKYEKGRARRETAAAEKAEMDTGVMAGRLVYREDVQLKSTRAFAMCSQSLDAIPDELEAKFGLDLDLVEGIRAFIDSAKQNLANKLRDMFLEGEDEEAQP